MCGRFTQKTPPAELAAAFGLDAVPEDLGARYNIAPSQDVLVVANRDGPRRAEVMRWGLVPHWATDPSIGDRLANARAETAAVKPSFRQALRQRRGLLLMDGFYEWQTEGRAKLPWHFHLPAHAPFAVAALWETWTPPGGQDDAAWTTVCLLTTDASPAVAAVHDRMPVILPPEAWPMWLSVTTPRLDALQALLTPWHGPLQADAVSRWVNHARHEGPACLEPAAPPLSLWR